MVCLRVGSPNLRTRHLGPKSIANTAHAAFPGSLTKGSQPWPAERAAAATAAVTQGTAGLPRTPMTAPPAVLQATGKEEKPQH